jgi:uncharacterized protein (DUF1778 family)
MEKTQTGLPTPATAAVPTSQAPEPTCSVRLSERDESQIMASAENPPEPNVAAVQAARRLMQRHG